MFVLRFLVSQGTAYCIILGMPLDADRLIEIMQYNKKYLTSKLTENIAPDEVYNLFLKLFP